MDAQSTVRLLTGNRMPVMGLGTWQLTRDTAGTVQEALRLGYRMIDTAVDYRTQPDIGQAIRQSGIDRREIFLVTKVEEYEDAYDATIHNLRELALDYADLVLIHRPPPGGPGRDLWAGLIRAREDGYTTDIGVSNYSIEQIDELVKATGEVPVVNQLEWSPFGWSGRMLDYCRGRGIVIQAYSPLTRARRLDDPRLVEIAAAYDKTPAQLLVRWNLQLEVAPIPKANRHDHLRENLAVFDFEITEADMAALNDLNEAWSSLGPSLQYIQRSPAGTDRFEDVDGPKDFPGDGEESGAERRVANELVRRGRKEGGISLSEVEALTERFDLGGEEIEGVYRRLSEEEIEVADDCGRAGGRVVYANGEVAEATADTLNLFLGEIGRYPLLSAAEEVELAQRIEAGDTAAKERMINSNLRLVVFIAKRYQGHGLPLLDLVQEGILGLIRAVERFDWRKGFRFSTYATFGINMAVVRALQSQSRTIRLPHRLAEREHRVGKAEQQLRTRLGRWPTDEEVAAATDLTPGELRDLRQAARAVTSLDLPVSENHDLALADLVAVTPPGFEDEIHVGLGHQALRRAVERLPEPHRSVIKLRYGLEDDAPVSRAEVGRRLGLSARPLGRIESEALARLAVEREIEALAEAA